MPWRPIHEAHSIERVRALFEFDTAISDKIIQKSTQDIRNNASTHGFNQVAPAASNQQTVEVSDQLGAQIKKPRFNGWILQRATPAELVEEVGFRDSVFGYYTTEYGRWVNLMSRLEDVLFPAIEVALGATDISKFRLEYSDRFIFEGDPLQADVREVLSKSYAPLPFDTTDGTGLWHSHAGWFEEHLGLDYLVNRNFDVVDLHAGEDETRRGLSVFNMVEVRSDGASLEMQQIKVHLEEMHRRTVLNFARALSDTYRQKVGIDIKDYESE